MPSVDPLPLHDAADPRPPRSVPDRDGAARDAARRALSRAAREHEVEQHASAGRVTTMRRPPKRRHSLAAACAVLVLGAGTVSVAVRSGPAIHDVTDPNHQAADEIVAARGAGTSGTSGEPGAGESGISPSVPSELDGVRDAQPVLFPTGSAQLDPAYTPLLDAYVVLMTVHPAVVLQVVGHTDDTGSDETNRVLSLARAHAAVSYVKAKGGFDDARFLTQGAGASQPVADNATAEGRRANRRIEVTFVGWSAPPNR